MRAGERLADRPFEPSRPRAASRSREPSARGTHGRSSVRSRPGRSPTSASSTSVTVTSPSIPPYSSTTSAARSPVSRKRSSNVSDGVASGTNNAGRTAALGTPPTPSRAPNSRSLVRAIPTTASIEPRAITYRVNPVASMVARIAAAVASTSIHTRSGRGVIRSATLLSPNQNRFSTMSLSPGSNTPAAAPSLTSAWTSSSLVGGSTVRPTRSRRNNPSVEALNKVTSGVATVETTDIGRAIARAMRSGAPSAMRLGTSSPTTSERYVMAATTIVSAMPPLQRPITGTPASRSASGSAMVAPPYAPANTPTNVIPTCTVARKRLGSPTSASAAAAGASPASASACKRDLRDDTTAISAIANAPFAKISSTTNTISNPTRTSNGSRSAPARTMPRTDGAPVPLKGQAARAPDRSAAHDATSAGHASPTKACSRSSAARNPRLSTRASTCMEPSTASASAVTARRVR